MSARVCMLVAASLALIAGEPDPRLTRVLEAYAVEVAKADDLRSAVVRKAEDQHAASVAKSAATAVSSLKRLVTSRLDPLAQVEVYRHILRLARDDADARRFFTTIGTLDQVLAELAEQDLLAKQELDLLGEPVGDQGLGYNLSQGYVERLHDSAFSASSAFATNHGPHLAKFSLTDTVANWSARTNDTSQWLQIDLGRPVPVGAVGTMGRHNSNQWVTSYRLMGSLDGKTWAPIQRAEGGLDFPGNSDRSTPVAHRLPRRLVVRYLRFLPTAWTGYISMRIEVYPPGR